MATKSISTHAANLASAAANVATQMGGGTTTAEAQGIAEILRVLSNRHDIAATVLKLCDQTKTLPNFG